MTKSDAGKIIGTKKHGGGTIVDDDNLPASATLGELATEAFLVKLAADVAAGQYWPAGTDLPADVSLWTLAQWRCVLPSWHNTDEATRH